MNNIYYVLSLELAVINNVQDRYAFLKFIVQQRVQYSIATD